MTELEKKQLHDRRKFAAISVCSLVMFFGIWYLLSAVGIFLTDYVSYYIFHEGTHPVYRKKKKGCAEGEFVIK